jgi:hypothetical protein
MLYMPYPVIVGQTVLATTLTIPGINASTTMLDPTSAWYVQIVNDIQKKVDTALSSTIPAYIPGSATAQNLRYVSLKINGLTDIKYKISAKSRFVNIICLF